MTIADTSAWVEYLRDRRSQVADRLAHLITRSRVGVCEPVVMEILAGARTPADASRLSALLSVAEILPVGGLRTWESAATIYHVCRASGSTPRSQLDCLIAAVAIREEVPVLHADRDFDLIARHTSLRVAAAD